MNLPGTSKYIYGSHEPMPRDVMPAGWILFLAEVGDNPEPHPGKDFGEWERDGYGIICRIQYRWGHQAGTLPRADNLDAYVRRVATMVQNSRFCHRWIIGNEPNLSIARPDGWKLSPAYVALCYNECWDAIHDLPGHELDEVLVPPVGPWNVETGVWIDYFKQLLAECDHVDGIAIHTYSRGPDPASITSEDRMSPPYQMYHNGFRTYRDWLAAVPDKYKDRPVYLTETNQNGPWLDERNGWVPKMYQEIDQSNQSGAQVIRCACLYRWPKYDPFGIDGKANVIADWKLAQQAGYTWPQGPGPEPEPEAPTLTGIQVSIGLQWSDGTKQTYGGTLQEIK